MNNRLPNSFSDCIAHLQRKVARRGINYSLDRLSTALIALNKPEQSLPTTIHIAGTNGKGSVAHYINQALIYQNCSVLSYTSPHINCYTERFVINGRPINKQDFCDLFYTVNESDSDDMLSEYEILTLMALFYANQSSIDFLILETGLGGRLDATNVIPNSIAVITDIGLDHCDILGHSITEIATEKAGIIKQNSSIITHSDLPPEVKAIIISSANAKQATIDFTPEVSCASFHERNKALAKQTCHHISIPTHNNLANYIDDCFPPTGRMSSFDYLGTPCTIDVGHNVNAVQAILSSHSSTPFSWIIGMQQKKDYLAVIQQLIDHHQIIYLCNFDPLRSVSIDQVPTSLNAAISSWEIGDQIPENCLFFGSFFFIEALVSFQKSIKMSI